MQVFIILAIVSLVVVFSVMKLLQYRKENSEDCEGEWLWTECDKKCSGGDSVRYGTFRTTKEATYNGKCEYKTGDKITEACPASECPPENCEGGEVWSETCEGSCSDGDATLYGKYIVTSKERYLGEKCPYEPDEILRKDCPVNMCPPEDCEGYWEQDEECRDGLCSVDPKPQIRSVYKITKESAHGGASCEAGNGDTKTEDCPDAKCPAEDCEGYWEQEANCSGPCGGPGNPNGSTIKETFNITKAANSKGTCEFEGQERPKSCPDSKCPKEDCEGYFEPLQLPNCDNVGENEACMSDGSLYRNKNDTAGIFIPPGSTIAMYTTTGPFYGGTLCQNEYENGSIHAVPLSYIETSS